MRNRTFLLLSLVAGRLSLLSALALLAGCDVGGAAYRQLAAENVELKGQLAKTNAENERLTGDVQALRAQRDTLMGIEGLRVEAIPRVASVELGKWTGGYNVRRGEGKHDGKNAAAGRGHDAVKVYLIPRDGTGSVIKAPGSVTIRLFDLAAPEGAALLGQCEIPPRQLESQWFTGLLMPDHYSVVCPFDKLPERPDITIRAEFTDYVAGKTFIQVMNVRIELP